MIDRYAFVAAIAVGSIGWWAFRRSVLPLAVCLTALVASIAAGIVRAGLFVDGAPLPVLLAAAGEIALIGLLLFHVVGLGRRLKRTGHAAEGRMNGWRLTGLLSLLLLAMTLSFSAATPTSRACAVLIRSTARTSLILFAMAFAGSALVELAPNGFTRWQAAQPPLSRRLLRACRTASISWR
jgi:hypothetical protein